MCICPCRVIYNFSFLFISFKISKRSIYYLYSKSYSGTSLAVQWLRLCAPNAGNMALIPNRGTKISPEAQHGQKNSKTTLSFQSALWRKVSTRSPTFPSSEEHSALKRQWRKACWGSPPWQRAFRKDSTALPSAAAALGNAQKPPQRSKRHWMRPPRPAGTVPAARTCDLIKSSRHLMEETPLFSRLHRWANWSLERS